MYKVLISFSDPVDGGVYYAGKDTYPREGANPTEERIAYLMGNTNKFGRPVIEPIEGIKDEVSNTSEAEQPDSDSEEQQEETVETGADIQTEAKEVETEAEQPAEKPKKPAKKQ